MPCKIGLLQATLPELKNKMPLVDTRIHHGLFNASVAASALWMAHSWLGEVMKLHEIMKGSIASCCALNSYTSGLEELITRL